MKVIVNADDYGFHENANQAIARCFRDGVVTNTTAMITMPAFEAGLALARKEGFADRIGLHVNLSEGRPLTDGIKNSKILCDKEGNFTGANRKRKLLRFYMPSQEKIWIAEEIRAQMKAFLNLGLPERHYDSHGQVLIYWPVLPIALQCAKEFGFRTTRMFINMSSRPHCAELSLARRLYIKNVSNVIDRSSLRTTTHLGASWDLIRDLNKLPQNAIVELMVHPQYRDNEQNLTMSGRMVDWKTPYEESLGPVWDHRALYEMISFSELARQ
jgi:predicted glycoside hydrolase/deacetylase ChbG (UPF0249 family)